MPQAEFFFAATFHDIERVIRGAQELFNGDAVFRINSKTGAHGYGRFLSIAREPLANSQCGLAAFLFTRLGKNQHELIAAVTRGRINRPTIISQCRTQALDGAAARQMAIADR